MGRRGPPGRARSTTHPPPTLAPDGLGPAPGQPVDRDATPTPADAADPPSCWPVINPYHPVMARRLVSPTIVGRSEELAAITAALDGAMGGTPVHQLIAGEAGVGKSRLVNEIGAIASRRGFRVVSGSCADIGDGGVPYGPIVQGLRALGRALDEDRRRVVFGPSAGQLSRLVPSLDPSLPPDSSGPVDAAHARLLDAILGSLQRLAEQEPVLFIIEDLHWADPATREAIAFLIRQVETDPIVLLMTIRADELHRRHPILPWLAEMTRSGMVDRHDLQRLTLDQTSKMLEAILGTRPDNRLAEGIQDRSDGNPFFIEELVGAGDDRDARIPPTLREVLLARIVGLPPAAQSVVGVAAVAGRQVDHALLASVAALDEPDFLDALRTAIERHILILGTASDSGERDYAFRHALLQEAAYDDLLPGERQRLHRAFAEAFAGRGPGSGAMAAGHWAELAYHWSAARDDRRALEACVRAGEAASGAFAFADALRHDERALALWSTVDDPALVAGIDRVELLDRAASAAWLAGDSRRSVVLRREAVAELGSDGDPIRRGLALEQLGRASWGHGDADAALAACEAAIRVMPADPPTAERARVLAGYAQLLMLLDRWSESMERCQESIDMARVVGARQAEGHALNTLGLGFATAGRCTEGTQSLDLALAIARELGDADDIGRAYANLSEATFQCGDKQRAVEIVREGAAVTDAMGMSRTYGRFIRENGICYSFEIGDWTEADSFAQASIATLPSARAQRRYGLTNWLPLLVATGDPRADDRLQELQGLLDGYPIETQFNIPVRIVAAESALWHDDPERALESIRTGLMEAEGTQWARFRLRLYRVGMRAVADMAEIARARRDPKSERVAIQAGDDLWASLLPIIDEDRGRLGRPAIDEAEAQFATTQAEQHRLRNEPAVDAWHEAARRWKGRTDPYQHAYASWRAGEAALRDGDRATAMADVDEAHRIATDLGARPLMSAIVGLAGRSRLRLSSRDGRPNEVVAPAPADPFGLTPREREVLPFLVQGKTNRQIADTLFISENTAGVHVSNIIGKMGASSRTEAAGIAARLGLDEA